MTDHPHTADERPIRRIDVTGDRPRPSVTPESVAGASDPNPDAAPAFLAIDLSTARLSAGIVNLAGEVAVRDRVATPNRSVWPVVTRLIGRVLAATRADLRPVMVGVTCPGPIDFEHGTMKPVGLPIWQDFPVRRELEQLTALPVAIDTAGRGLARAEMWLGLAGRRPVEERSMATLVLGDDVDGALVERGRLVDGERGNLGQFGHLVVEPGGELCACGAEGCLTAYAGARSIEASTGRVLPRTPTAIIERTAIMAARGCATIAAMLDIGEIVVAGVIPQVFGRPFYDALDLELDERSRLPHLESLRVRPSSPAIGTLQSAAAIARQAWQEQGGDQQPSDSALVAPDR